MTTTYTFYLFGPPRLETNGGNVAINLRKALALLTYLAVNRQPHSRDALATLLWPDKESRIGRANLRRTLYDLSQQLATGGDASLIAVQEEKVLIPPAATLQTDVATFQQQLAQQLPPSAETPVDPSTLAALAMTAELYTDDFLAGFTLPDAPAFDDWQFFQREALRQQYSGLLAKLVAAHEIQRNYEEAIHYARRWSHLDRLDEEVHRRLMTLHAQAGQQAAAVRQYDECVEILQQELDAPPAEETTALFEAIRTRRFPWLDTNPKKAEAVRAAPAGAPVARMDLPVISVPLHNLPQPVTPFIGREQELAELLRRLADPTCHLLTLIGPGGIGKTRLAIEAATRLASGSPPSTTQAASPPLHFPDGIFLVELQAVQRVSGVIAAIAAAIGFRFYNAVPLPEQLMRFLNEKRMLLILDNCEQLLDDNESMADLLSTLLVAAPKLTLLVTSREALNLQEEWFHPLGGMGLPPGGRRASALRPTPTAADSIADAVQLFAVHARRARPDFDLATEHVAVAQICRLVDGVPLAIELAAAWLKVLSCRQIAEEIAQNLDILTTRHQNIPSRHRSMRAVLEQSWQLLADEAQQVLMRLAVFQSGFTQAAGAEVAGASLLTLAILTEKALVRTILDSSAHHRYQLHTLLRQFVTEKLGLLGQEAATTQTRHSTYYLDFLQQQAPRLLGKEQQQAVQAMSTDLDNIRAALAWAMQAGNSAMLLKTLHPLYSFYQIQSRYLEGKEFFVATLAQWQAAQPYTDEAAPQVALSLLARCGALSYLLCEYNVAEVYLQDALALAEQLNVQHERAFILNFLGRLAMWQGEKAQAKQQLMQSLTISQTLGDIDRTASALEKLANLIHATFGEYRESKTLALQSLHLSRAQGRPDRIAYALDTLGFATFCLGEYAEAEAYYKESLHIFEQSGDHYGQAMAFGGLALVYWALGGDHFADAIAYFQQSLFVCRELGHEGQIVGRLAGLARIANDQGNYEEAQQLAEEGLALARELGSPVYLSHMLYCLGEAAYAQGKLAQARLYLVEALQLTAATDLLANLAIVLFHYATLLVKESERDHAESIHLYSQAVALFGLVQQHPATWQVYKARAARRAAMLMAQSPALALTAPSIYTENAMLNEVVAEILRTVGAKHGTL